MSMYGLNKVGDIDQDDWSIDSEFGSGKKNRKRYSFYSNSLIHTVMFTLLPTGPVQIRVPCERWTRSQPTPEDKATTSQKSDDVIRLMTNYKI